MNKSKNMSENLIIKPRQIYLSEHLETWRRESIILGENAADGDEISYQELQKAIRDYDNIHRLRHAHLALFILYAKKISLESNIDIKIEPEVLLGNYIRDFFLNESKKKLQKINNKLLNSWILASMLLGLDKVYHYHKPLFRECISLLDHRIKEEGVFGSFLFSINELLPDIDEVDDLQKLFTLTKRHLNQQIKLDGSSWTNAMLFAKISKKYIETYVQLKIPKNKVLQDRELLKSQKHKRRELAESMLIDLINELYHNQFINDDINRQLLNLMILEVFEQFTVPQALSDVYQELKAEEKQLLFGLDYSKAGIKEMFKYINQNRLIRDYFMLKALEKADSKEIIEILEYGVNSLGADNAYPIIRGYKNNFQKLRINYENDIIYLLRQSQMSKTFPASKEFFSKYKNYRKHLIAAIHFIASVIKDFTGKNEFIGKDLSTVIVESMMSMYFIERWIRQVFDNLDLEKKKNMREVTRVVDSAVNDIIADDWQEYKSVYETIYKVLAYNPVFKIFKEMKAFCYVDDIHQIIDIYEVLSDFDLYESGDGQYHLDSIIKHLQKKGDPVYYSLLIYDFYSDISEKAQEIYEKPNADLSWHLIERAFIKIIIQKQFTDAIQKRNIYWFEPDLYKTELTITKLAVNRDIIEIRDLMAEWKAMRDDLFLNLSLDYDVRAQIIQKTVLIMSRLGNKLKSILPLPIYYLHEKMIKEYDMLTKLELKNLNYFDEKDDLQIEKMILSEHNGSTVLGSKNPFDNREYEQLFYHEKLQFMWMAISMHYAQATFNFRLSKTMRHFNLKYAKYLHLLETNQALQHKWVFGQPFVAGILISVAFGYLAPFILGGNGDFWSFYTEIITFPTALVLGLLMSGISFFKIDLIVNRNLGYVRQGACRKKRNPLFGRKAWLFAQGYFLALLLSSFGLLIFSPVNWFQAYQMSELSPLVRENLIILSNYLISFPPTALFIGLFLESRLENQ
jgi:hypothetical protein